MARPMTPQKTAAPQADSSQAERLKTKTKRTAPVRSRGLSRMGLTLLLTGVIWVALSQNALAEDGVVVLPSGGVTEGYVFELDTTDQGADTGSDSTAQVRDLGRRALVDSQLGPIAIRDLKILPDDSNLLSDVDGRGVAITGSDAAFRYTFAQPGERPRITSASVTAYAAPGEPTRVLVTDSNRSLAFVIDPGEETMVWQNSFALSGARATFANAIALPQNRAAFGLRWASLGVSAIDLYQTHSGEPTDFIRRLASASDLQFPPDTVVVSELAELRDVMGLPSGNLLVTTRYGLAEVTTEGDVVWAVDIGQTTDLRGEFASARLLPSGRVAVATYEPGVWTNPHINHRVHWLSAQALENSEFEIIASSSALSFAPARLEVAGGHGGSGTFGFRPGLDTTGTGDLSDLLLARELTLNSDNYRRGERIWGSTRIHNTGSDTVDVSRATIVLSSGACGATGGVFKTLADLTALQLGAGEGAELQGQRQVDQDFTPGRWCAQVHVQNASGASIELGAPVVFDVTEGGDDTGSTVVVRDLGHRVADAADVGLADASTPTDQDPEPGCACWTGQGPGSRGAVDASWLVFLLLGAGALMRRVNYLERRP